MKRRLLMILLVTISCNMQAQIQKGNFLAGGTLSFRSTDYTADNSKTSAWNLTPGGGYFILDKLALGARITFTYNSNDGDNYTDLLGGPFARYYFFANRKKNKCLSRSRLPVG